MSKTIEFVEKQILICNQNIDFQMQIAFESLENKFKKRYHENEALKLTEKLQMLLQIKTDLEAWEVAKEELQIVFKGKNYYGEPLRRYELNVIGQNKIDTLNKALEVEDEKEN